MKIGIIGVGSVGGAIAAAIVQSGIAGELALFDTDAKRLKSAASDLSHAAAFGHGTKITAAGYRGLSDADIIIIAAGANQKIGQSRRELAEHNVLVMRDVVPKIKAARKNPPARDNLVLIVVSNPLDSIATAVQKLSNLAPARVIGTGTMLDSARLRAELARHFDVSPKAVEAYVLGEHGETAVINWTSANIGGVALSYSGPGLRRGDSCRSDKPLTQKTKTEIEKRVKGAAMEIIQGRGATWDGIAAATLDLTRCVINDERRIMPVSILENEDVAYSMPRVVGRRGVIRTLAPEMSGSERAALAASVKAIRKTYKSITDN